MAARRPSAAGPEAELRKVREAIAAGKPPQVCLVCGEDSYLRGKAARSLGEALVPEADRTAFNFRVIEGGDENPIDLVASLRTYSLFGGPTVLWVDGTRLLVSGKNVAEVLQAAASAWAEASRGGDEAGRARATRDVLKVLTVRGLGLDALDPDGGEPADELLEEAGAGGWLADVAAYCKERELAPVTAGGEGALLEALEEGWPDGNTLVLVAEACDRRLKLFKALKKHGPVLDTGVAASGRVAEEASRRRVSGMAEEAGARLSPGARSLLEKKVGFDLARLEREIEKLATFVGPEGSVGEEEVEALVGWTREEGQWELSNAVQERDLGRALRALRRTLDAGVPPVRIFFQVVSKLRDILHAHACVEGPLANVWRRGMDERGYRSRVRPRVEALVEQDREGTPAILRSHPWALFKSLEATDRYQRGELLEALESLYRTNRALVSGAGPAPALLEQLVVGILSRRVAARPARHPALH